MKYEVIPTSRFEEDVWYYLKKKKFKSILNDVDEVVKELENGNLIGDSIPGLTFEENITIKVRVANSDTKVGKSNGYRIIYYVVKDDYEIYLLTIYYKKEDNKIPTNDEIRELVKKFCM
jgi:mRNA-degrading endonuclease RelE of RelBE toxin-antitoxin system